MCKPKLYFLIKLRNPRLETFKIDALLYERGHSALRLPPYHRDLNPMEPMWGSVKECYTRNNVGLRCNNTRQFERNYLRLEHIINDIAQQILLNLQNYSDTSNEEEQRKEEVS
jgi:hypothetical protein